MSFLFADRKKQIAVVNIPSSNTSGLMVTGSIDLLNHNSVAGLANATLVGNLTEAANLIYPSSRGSLFYQNGLIVEGLPHIALSPEVGTVTAGYRTNGVGLGLGYSVISTSISSSTRIYNRPEAVLDILAADADLRVTGGYLSSAGTASIILAGSKANPGAVSGFRIDSVRTTVDPTISSATLYIKPYNINTNLSALVSINYDGNVGIGTDIANTTLHVVSNLPSVSTVEIVNTNTNGYGVTVRTNSGAPLRVITGYPNNEAIGLLVNGVGQVGVKMDPTGVGVTENNMALAVNGSIRSINTVFAFGTFQYSSGTFLKLDRFNVDSITATPTTITINFLENIVAFDSTRDYTVLATETSSSGAVLVKVTSKTASNVSLTFIDSKTGSVTSFSEFSFAVFSNTTSIYESASIVQAVF